MASLSSNPSSVVSAGTWTGGANVYLSDNVFATNTGATQNTEYPLEVGGFNFTGIPAGSTIDSVTVTIEAKTGTAARAQIKGELLDGSTVLGTRALANLTAADANYTFTPTATLAQMQSANLKVRVTNKRIVSQASTTSVDWVKIDVVYTPIPPAVTQAAYRFYADGTETGATALAGQDTAPTVDTSSGDVNLGLRVRLQETNAGVVPASTDWQLQWEKNTSGTWVDTADGPALAITYPASNEDNWLNIGTTSSLGFFISVHGNGQPLERLRVRQSKQGVATGNLTGTVYAHTGTFGTGTGTGTPLTTSTTTVTAASLSTTSTWTAYDFDGSFTLASGTDYFLGVQIAGHTPSGTDNVRIGTDATPAYAGNTALYRNDDSWATSTHVLIFEVYSPASIVPYNSANLTDAAATTNRLTGGTGTFVAGKVSEDGLVDDVGWSASNHTEVLYSLTLKQADLAPSDTLRFRVLKDGVAGSPVNPALADSYSVTLQGYSLIPEVADGAFAQSFLGDGRKLARAGFRIGQNGTPNGTVTAKLYAHDGGTFGGTGKPTGTALATSTTVINSTAIPTIPTTVITYFDFAETFTLAAGTPYFVTIESNNTVAGAVTIGTSGLTPKHPGNSMTRNGGVWGVVTTRDLHFEVYTAGDLIYTAVPSVSIGAGGPATIQATAALVAASTLTATAVPERAAAVTLTAASTLTVAGVPARVASVALSAVSTLTATGTVQAPAPEIAATAALTASATLSATGVRIPQASVSLVAASTLTVTATRFGVLLATVPLTATSTLTATAVRIPQATASLTATSTLTATGIRTQHATAALVGASELTTGAVVARVPMAALSAVSTLTATGVREPQATVSLTASSTLAATATTTPAVFGTVAMSAAATLTATAVREPQAAASLVAASTLTVTAVRQPQATVALTAASTLAATAVRVVIVGGAPTPYLTEVLADTVAGGPVWLCNEAAGAPTTADSSGNGLTGTNSGSVAFGAAGSGVIAGYPTAATFNGTSTSLITRTTGLATLGTTPAFSLEVWVKGTPASSYVLGHITDSTATSRCGVGVSSGGKGYLRVYNSSSAAIDAIGTKVLTDGNPHHLVGVCDAPNSILRIYVDGVQEATAPTTGTGLRFPTNLLIGGGITGVGSMFVGKAGGAAYYPGVALSSARVAAHYAAGTGAAAGAGVPLSAVSTLTASAITFGATGGAAVLTASSTLTATGIRTQQTTAALSAVSTLTATATTSAAPVVSGAVALTAASTLTATAVRQPQASVSLTATAVLTVTGVRVRVVSVSLTASSSLTATPTRVRPATVPLTAAATLTVQLVRIPQAAAGMTATSVLVATATITAAAVGIPNAAHTGFLHALDTDRSWYPVTVPS